MPAQLVLVLTVLRFFEPPLRLTLRLPLRVADGFGLATPQMKSFKCAGPSVNEAWIALGRLRSVPFASTGIRAKFWHVSPCAGSALAPMITGLPYWKSPYRNSAPLAAGLFVFDVPARLQQLTGRSDNKSLVRGGCLDPLRGGRDHGNSHFSNRLNLDAAPV